MAKSRFNSYLEGLTNVALIAAAIAFVWMVLSRPTSATPAPATEPSYGVGEPFSLAGLDSAAVTNRQSTLVLYLRSTCKYCTESMAFYKRLASLGSRPRLVVVGYESKNELSEYVLGHGFVADDIVPMSRNSPEARLRGTPTLVLVNAGGTVGGMWRGRLDSTGEANVLEAMAALK